jgi:hypothetical protein
MATKDDYLARAAASLIEAEAARLDNVRERCLRSAAAWTEMAAGAQRADTIRARREQDIAAAADSAAAAEAI